MMITIPDDVLKDAGLTEREVQIEVACRLFQAKRLHLWPAARLAGLTRVEMEGELFRRGIPAYEITEEEFRHDREGLLRLDT